MLISLSIPATRPAPIIALLAITFWVALLGPSRVVWADASAEAVFQSLYSEDLRRVAASLEPADDIALGRKLVEAAANSTGQPALVVLMCEKAYDLTKTHRDGAQIAIGALQLLADTVPEKRVGALALLAPLLDRQFRAARNADQQQQVGEMLVATQVMLGDLYSQAGNYRDAVKVYNEALAIAGRIRYAQLDTVQTRVEVATWRIRSQRRLEGMVARYLGRPDDATVNRELFQIYLVDFDAPAEAARYAPLGASERDRELLALVLGEPRKIPTRSLLALGEWYRDHADRTTPGAKRAMNRRAAYYYLLFLNAHRDDDLVRKQAQLALTKITREYPTFGELQNVIPEVTPLPAPSPNVTPRPASPGTAEATTPGSGATTTVNFPSTGPRPTPIVHLTLDRIDGLEFPNAVGGELVGVVAGTPSLDREHKPTFSGRENQASLRLNGIPASVSIERAPPIGPEGAVSFWASTGNPHGERVRVLFSHSADLGDTKLRLGANGNRLFALVGDLDPIETEARFGDGTWHHILLTWANGQFMVYFNGSMVANGTFKALSSPPEVTYYFGRPGLVRDRYWEGHLDDLRIYHVGLTEDQVRSIAAGRY